MSDEEGPDFDPYEPGSGNVTTMTVYKPEQTPAQVIAVRATQVELVDTMMLPGVHFGKVPGVPKPFLWQPGAQLLDILHGFSPTFQLLDKLEDWQAKVFSYTFKCALIHRQTGKLAGEGIGNCNSGEKKYREAKYHGADEGKLVDPRDLLNTFMKMACKRAHVAATLNATGMADYFTQDVEGVTGQHPGEASTGNGGLGVCPAHNKPLINGTYGLYCPTKVMGNDGKERWCKGTGGAKKAAAPKKAAPAAGEPVDKATGEIFPTRDAITNVGQLLTASLNFFGLSRAETLDALGKKDTLDIADPGAEWEKLIEKYQEQGEPPTET